MSRTKYSDLFIIHDQNILVLHESQCVYMTVNACIDLSLTKMGPDRISHSQIIRLIVALLLHVYIPSDRIGFCVLRRLEIVFPGPWAGSRRTVLVVLTCTYYYYYYLLFILNVSNNVQTSLGCTQLPWKSSNETKFKVVKTSKDLCSSALIMHCSVS